MELIEVASSRVRESSFEVAQNVAEFLATLEPHLMRELPPNAGDSLGDLARGWVTFDTDPRRVNFKTYEETTAASTEAWIKVDATYRAGSSALIREIEGTQGPKNHLLERLAWRREIDFRLTGVRRGVDSATREVESYHRVHAVWLDVRRDLGHAWVPAATASAAFIIAMAAGTSSPTVGEHPAVNLVSATVLTGGTALSFGWAGFRLSRIARAYTHPS